jgi:hypothetical protein
MLLPTYINVNKNGIPTVSSVSIKVTDSNVAFQFNPHKEIGSPFRGLIIVRLDQSIPESTTATLPVVFTTGNFRTADLTSKDGSAIRASDITSTGIYLCWYESQTNTLQLIA